MGYENLGYLLSGVVVFAGIVFIRIGGRLAKGWLRVTGVLLAFLGVMAIFNWLIYVGRVRAGLQSAKQAIILPPSQPGLSASDRASLSRMEQQLEQAKRTCRAFGWKWGDL